MRILLVTLVFTICISVAAGASDFYDRENWRIAVRPRHVNTLRGPRFVLNNGVSIVAENPADRDKAAMLRGHILKTFGLTLRLANEAEGRCAMVLRRDGGARRHRERRHREEYSLHIDQGGMILSGADERAIYNGLGTMFTILADQRLMLSAEGELAIPPVEISDWPAMTGFRGLNLQMTYMNPNDGRSIAAFIDAMFRLHYNTVIFEIGKNWQSNTRGANGGYTRRQIRKMVAYAKARGMEVIPAMNLLGHPGRGPDWLAKAAGSIDLGKPENYRLLARMLDEIVEDFGKPRFFHGGMDEASKEMRANAQKYEATERDLLAAHIRKVNDIVKERGMRLIIWHDMLVADKTTGEVDNGSPPPNGTAAARALIPKDIIINVWDYNVNGGRNCTRIFQHEGFEVINIGWMDFSIPLAATVAFERSTLGMITGIWSDSVLRDKPSHNMYWTNEHRQRIMALAAEYSWFKPSEIAETVANIREPGALSRRVALPYDPAVVSVEARWDRTTRTAGRCGYLDLSANAADRNPGDIAPAAIASIAAKVPARGKLCYLRGMPFLMAEDSYMEIQSFFDGGFDSVRRAGQCKYEGVVKRNGKLVTKFDVSGFDRARKTDDLIIYTNRRLRTGANIYGFEIIVANREVVYPPQFHNSGDSRIPRNGFVISAHGASRNAVSQVRMGDRIQLFKIEAGNRSPALDPRRRRSARPEPVVINLAPRRSKRLVFLHTTAYPTMPGRKLGRYVVRYENGRDSAFDLIFAKNIGAFNETTGLFDPLTSRKTWLAYSNYGRSNAQKEPVEVLYAHEWRNPFPQEPIVRVTFLPEDEAFATGWLLLGITQVL